MTFDQLTYFVEVARLGHLGRASRSLAISPSAVSHAIKKLEDELGRELFSREGKRLFLSAHGLALLPRAEAIVRSVVLLKDDLQEDATALTGHLRIAATHGLASNWIAAAWGDVLCVHPRLTLELFSLRTAQVVQAVAAREVDMGFGYSPVAPSSVSSQVVARMRLVVAVREGHPILEERPSLRSKLLSEYPSAAPKAFSGVENCESHPLFDTWNLKPHVPLVFDDYGVARSMLVASNAWALMPEWVVGAASDLRAAIEPSMTQAPLSVTALWPKAREPGKALRVLMGEVKRRFRGT